jgi:hypothetical protein
MVEHFFLYARKMYKEVDSLPIWQAPVDLSLHYGLAIRPYPKPRKSALLATCFYSGFLLGLFFEPEDGCVMFIRNIG